MVRRMSRVARRTPRSAHPARAHLANAATLAAALTTLLTGVAAPRIAAQDEQVLAALRGTTGIDPEPGTLLATISKLSVANTSLAEALVRLAERSNVQIAFSPSLLPTGLRVDCDCATLNLAKALDRLLADTDLGYVELGSQVVIAPRSDRLRTAPGSLSGRVRSEVAVPLEDATVRLLSARDSVMTQVAGTDPLGFFAFHELVPGPYNLVVEMIGYRLHEERIEVLSGKEVRAPVILSREALPLEGVVVEAPRNGRRTRFEESAGITAEELSLAQLRAIPGVAASDPIRALDVLPGVTRVSDFTAAFNVRGGSGDQNLILMDGIPIFHPFHMLGAFSVFNPDMVGRAELQVGGFAAQYGGRVSSVLLVESDPGDGELAADAALSLLDSRLAVRGGLPVEVRSVLGLSAAHWRVSARRSYWDVVTRLGWSTLFPYNLTDYQAAFEGWTQRGNRVRINAYSGRDRVTLRNLQFVFTDTESITDEADIPEDAGEGWNVRWPWGNDAVGASWTHLMPGGGTLEVRGSISRFSADFAFTEFGDRRMSTSIDQGSVEADLELRPTPRIRWRSGLVAGRTAADNMTQGIPPNFQNSRETARRSGAYTQLRWAPNPRWLLEGGLRLDHWRPNASQPVTTLSPRIAAKRFLGNGDWAVRMAGGRYSQFLHSLRDERLPLSPDVWVIAGEHVPALVSDQFQAGVEGFFGNGGDWVASVEGYYRTYDGAVAQNWAEDPTDPSDDLLTGEAKSYGIDAMVRRDSGQTTGWISLSLLKARQTFVDTDSGLYPAPVIEFPPVFDRRVELDLALRREVNWGVEAGLRWNLGTGLPYTRPIARYEVHRQRLIDLRLDEENTMALLLGPRNGERYPVRHRLDISLRRPVYRSWGTVTPYLNVINVYNRKNVLFYYFNYGPGRPERTGSSMLPVLPSLGVEVSF